MKKVMSVLLCLCIILCTFSTVSADALEQGETTYWDFTPNHATFGVSAFSSSFTGENGFVTLTSGDSSFKIYDTTNEFSGRDLTKNSPNAINVNAPASNLEFILGTWGINNGYFSASNCYYLPTSGLQIFDVFYKDGSSQRKYAISTKHSAGAVLEKLVYYAPKYDADGNVITYEGEEMIKEKVEVCPYKPLTAANVTADNISAKTITLSDLILPDDIYLATTQFEENYSPSVNLKLSGKFEKFSVDLGAIKDVTKIQFVNSMLSHINYPGALAIHNDEYNYDYTSLIPIEINGANENYNYYMYFGRLANSTAFIAGSSKVANKHLIKSYEDKITEALSKGNLSLKGLKAVKEDIIAFCEDTGLSYEKDFDKALISALESKIAELESSVKDYEVYADTKGVYITSKYDLSGKVVTISENGTEIASGEGYEVKANLKTNTPYTVKIGNEYKYDFIIKELVNENFDVTLTGASAFYMTDTYNCSTVYDKRFVLYNNTVYIKPEFEVDLYKNYTLSFDISGYGNSELAIGFNANDIENTQLLTTTSAKSADGFVLDKDSVGILSIDGNNPIVYNKDEEEYDGFTTGTVNMNTSGAASYLELTHSDSTDVTVRKLAEKINLKSGTYTRDLETLTTMGGLVFAAKDGASIDNLLITTCQEYVEKVVRDNAEIKIVPKMSGTILSKSNNQFKTTKVTKDVESRIVEDKDNDAQLMLLESLSTLKPLGNKITLDNLNNSTTSDEFMTVTVKKELEGAELCMIYDNKEAMFSFSFDDGLYAAAQYYFGLFKEFGLKGTACLRKNTDTTAKDWPSMLNTPYMDVSNHSLNHKQYRNYAENTLLNRAIVEQDINEARMIYKNVFPSEDIVTYIAPYGAVNEMAQNLMAGYHWANRGASMTYSQYASIDPTEDQWFKMPSGTVTLDKSVEQLNKWLDTALAQGNWFIELLHGIEEDDVEMPSSTSYNIKKGVCREHFEYAASLTDRMWCATLEEGVKYIRERQNANLEVYYKDGDTIAVSLTDTLPDRIFDFPLTVKIPVPADWTEVKGENIESARVENGFAYVNIIPDTGIAEITKK